MVGTEQDSQNVPPVGLKKLKNYLTAITEKQDMLMLLNSFPSIF